MQPTILWSIKFSDRLTRLQLTQNSIVYDSKSRWYQMMHCVMLQLLEMSFRTGCHLKNTTKYGLSYVCSGRHQFIPGPVGPAAGSERQILVAIDNCRLDQLVARYRVQMYGFVCSSAASLGLPLPTVDWKLALPTSVISIVRAVICAVFAQVFFCLGSFVASASSTSRLMPS